MNAIFLLALLSSNPPRDYTRERELRAQERTAAAAEAFGGQVFESHEDPPARPTVERLEQRLAELEARVHTLERRCAK